MDHLAKPLFHTDLVKRKFLSSQLRRRPIRKANTHPRLSGILCMLVLLAMALCMVPLMLGDCTFWEEGDTKWSVKEKIRQGLLAGCWRRALAKNLKTPPYNKKALFVCELWRFFSNQPLTYMSASPAWLDFHGKHVLGWFGALQISALAGLVVGLCTYSCMFYDSSQPGSFPPSPISPHRSRNVPMTTEYALGYKVVPVNVLIFTTISVILLRLYLNLPFY